VSSLALRAPLAGWCLPLGEVPDPVFAQRMAGDGVAIDPTQGVLHAPCDGEIVLMKNAKHAVTLRAQGVDILMHVGIDTVELGGLGFELLVAGGQRVRAGEPLLRFDLDQLARRAKSLVSPIVVASGGAVVRRAAPGPLAVGDFMMEVDAAQAAAAARSPSSTAEGEATRTFVVPFDHGLHARPAAQVAAALRPFAAEVTLTARGRGANARSTVALMALGVRCGDEVEARAAGADAVQALDALGKLLASPAVAAAPASAKSPGAVPPRIEAAIASRGLAMGPCVPWTAPEIAVEELGAGEAQETEALEAALAAVVAALEALQREAGGETHALLAAHIELARDPDLRERAAVHLKRGHGAGHAWRQATRSTAEVLLALDDERMRERAADLRDLENQVLRVLSGKPPGTTREFPPGAIVVAEDLLPSQMMALERARVGGVCTARGGTTSHAAILAAAAGMPALVAAGDAVLAIAAGTMLGLDAEHGWLDVDPSSTERSSLERKIEQRRTEGAADLAAAADPAATRDGVRITVNANLGSFAEVSGAVAHGAEGCGLLRTEFLFLERRDPPSEDEQAREYQRIADGLGGRPLAIRTMDIGGDKPIAYLPLDPEENPALGLRGVRASLEHPHLLRDQLRAILRVRPPGVARILLPMVTDVDDVRFVRLMVDELVRELRLARSPAIGAMVETPASALLAPSLAEECDFLSIGTNDLSQYTLAIDRGHPRLAARLDALHPAVLRLIAMVAEAARAHGRSASVCGALGSDVDALPMLIGLGIHEVSATSAAIPRLKRMARTLDAGECRELARRALEQSTAQAVRELAAVARAHARGHYIAPATSIKSGG
jgi:phosphoenolpyruvate-protein phosphotransferase